ncbi:L,D-transpeptidase family protein [uncultured Microbulbifer sp.]|uniref:L,D-transpeptidase family protein n=1 Tax=uncultured Microbulbifer sp. TaxID=348147 RepID=UPI0025ECC8B5|nr:L,D-transpeptidase family protein [uncultured Microbulbifer sp.]
MGHKGDSQSTNPLLNRAALAAVLISLATQAAGDGRSDEQSSTAAEEKSAQETAGPAATGSQPDRLDGYSPFTPYGRQYALMREERARYHALSQEDVWQPLPDGQPLAPGMQDNRVRMLRSLLMQYGDLPLTADMDGGDSEATRNPEHYDKALRRAVERFQRRHGLRADGIVDKNTRTELNTPPEQKLAVLDANLQRWQQMPKDLGQRYILVNIPEYTLRLIDREREQYRMRVVVGKPKHATPELATRLTRVVFNPTWTVPANIALRELLPKGSAKLVAGGYRLVNNRGKSVPFSGRNLRALRLGSVALQQRGGEGNALGRFKFVIPNRQAIFLHDTNHKTLFKKRQRAFSHGCIRLEKPQELAQILLDSQGSHRKWNEEKLARVTTGTRTRAVELLRPIPVYIAYWTAWVDEEGLLNFRPDIYGRDHQQNLVDNSRE